MPKINHKIVQEGLSAAFAGKPKKSKIKIPGVTKPLSEAEMAELLKLLERREELAAEVEKLNKLIALLKEIDPEGELC